MMMITITIKIFLSLFTLAMCWGTTPTFSQTMDNSALAFTSCLLWTSRSATGESLVFSQVFLFLLFFNVYFWKRETETECEQGRSREIGKHRIRNRLQALSRQHRARCGAHTHKPWDQDLSQSWTLNQLSHPGAPLSGLSWACILPWVYAWLSKFPSMHMCFWVTYFWKNLLPSFCSLSPRCLSYASIIIFWHKGLWLLYLLYNVFEEAWCFSTPSEF